MKNDLNEAIVAVLTLGVASPPPHPTNSYHPKDGLIGSSWSLGV